MKKFLSIAALSALFVFSFGANFVPVANAQVSSFPAGCTSTIGTSTTSNLPCNGTSVATTSFFPGCNSILGFSTTTGLACNGGASSIAATTFFPGCTSVMGFSTVTGRPCSGGVALTSNFIGCSSTLGSSTVTGLPCSGGLVPLSFLAGCSSIFGVSTINGLACNGTSSPVYDPGLVLGVSDETPGLPVTGAGGNASTNMLLLLGSGVAAILGGLYLVRSKRQA